MAFTLKFKTDNAAFGEVSAKGVETARILRELATRVEDYDRGEGPVMDINGNKIGEWSLR